jgi:ABC-type branched-subunit amino acid transport system substrate-binding protein
MVALLLVVAACSSDDSGDTTTTTEAAAATTTTTAVAGDTTTTTEAASGLAPGNYKIGFVALTTGAVAFAGVPHENGLRLAETNINESGFLGEGVTIEFVREDAGGDQPTAIGIVDGYIADEEILGIICCALSSVAGAIQPAIVDAGIPWIDHAAIAPTITDPPNAVRSFPLSQPSTAQIAQASVDAFQPTNAVVTVTADNDGLQSDLAANLSVLEENGVEVLDVIDTFADDTDLSGPATQIVALNPDIVYLAQLGNTESLIIQELRDRGYAGPIVGNLAIATDETFAQAGNTLVGTVLPLAFFAGNPDPLVQTFAALYADEYDTTADIFAAQGWQAAWYVATALKAGGEGTRDALMAGVNSIDTMETVFGTLTWDDRGEPMTEKFTFVQWSPAGILVIWDSTAEGLLPNVNL